MSATGCRYPRAISGYGHGYSGGQYFGVPCCLARGWHKRTSPDVYNLDITGLDKLIEKRLADAVAAAKFLNGIKHARR